MPTWGSLMTDFVNDALKVTLRAQDIHRAYTAALRQNGGRKHA